MSDWITRRLRPVRESVPVYTAAFWRGLDRLRIRFGPTITPRKNEPAVVRYRQGSRRYLSRNHEILHCLIEHRQFGNCRARFAPYSHPRQVRATCNHSAQDK